MRSAAIFLGSWARLLAAIGAACVLAAAGGAQAQAFPQRPVELTVMFPAGSSADLVARLLAKGMEKNLGQTVIVANRPGAGGAIAYRYLHAQKPDGYSMIFYSNSISTLYFSNLLSLEPTAFDPVARVTVELPVIAVRGDAPWKNLHELIAYAQRHPGALRVGNSGVGSHTEITASAFFGDNGADVTHVAFGTSQVVTTLVGGHIDAVVQLPGALASYVQAGTLKVLGTLGTTREPAFADVPTAREQGYNFQADMWRGVAVPKGTPAAVLARLQEAVRAAVQSPEFKAQGSQLGFLPAYQPREEFAETVNTEHLALGRRMHHAILGAGKAQP